MQDKEVWKDIKDYEGYYQISNLGRVKSLSRPRAKEGINGIIKERILTLSVNGDGYQLVKFYKDGKNKTFRVHRLVAECFIEKVKGKKYINHIDGDKLNNNVKNLEWCTSSENNIHAFKMGLNPTKLNLNKDKLNNLYNNKNLKIKDISKVFNCSEKTVRRYLEEYDLKEKIG